MEDAFGRLTAIQQRSINKRMFEVACQIVLECGDSNTSAFKEVVRQHTVSCPHLAADLFRYCKLAESVIYGNTPNTPT